MPAFAAATIPFWAAAAPAAASTVGTVIASRANGRAAKTQAQADADALAFSREQEAERRREYDQEQAQAKAAWDAQEARRAPYRQASANALMRLSQLAGIAVPTLDTGPRTMPTGWTPDTATQTPATVPISSLLNRPSRVQAMVPVVGRY